MNNVLHPYNGILFGNKKMKHTETQSDYLGLAGEGAEGKAWE